MDILASAEALTAALDFAGLAAQHGYLAAAREASPDNASPYVTLRRPTDRHPCETVWFTTADLREWGDHYQHRTGGVTAAELWTLVQPTLPSLP